MVASVGQQTVGGKRAPNGFLGRSLPHFEVGSRQPDAKGFVENSFFTGTGPSLFSFSLFSSSCLSLPLVSLFLLLFLFLSALLN